jgi:hypothetical protein
MKPEIERKMDPYFLRNVQKLLKGKTPKYKGELMRRIKKSNAYMNLIGRSVHSIQFVLTLMLELDKEYDNEGYE